MYQYQDRALQEENLRLREENARLKTENRRLHDELAESARSNETLLATNRRLQERLQMRPMSHGQVDPRVATAFRQFDKNGSGKIDYRELRSAFQHLGIACETSEAVEVLQAYDGDGNGLLDLYEFAGLAERLGFSMRPPTPSRLPAPRVHSNGPLDSRVVAIFRRFDRNGSGQLDYREIRTALGELGVDCTTDQAVRVLQAYDVDGNGLLDLHEFNSLAQRLGLSLQTPGYGGGGYGGGAMSPYGAPYGGMIGRSPGGRYAMMPRRFEYGAGLDSEYDGDLHNSGAWKRLPRNVAQWTTADVVSWLVQISEILFIETFVRRQITGVTLLSLHLSSDDSLNDVYELDNSPTDLRHIMADMPVDELRLRGLFEHVAMLRKHHRRARQEEHAVPLLGKAAGTDYHDNDEVRPAPPPPAPPH